MFWMKSLEHLAVTLQCWNVNIVHRVVFQEDISERCQLAEGEGVALLRCLLRNTLGLLLFEFRDVVVEELV